MKIKLAMAFDPLDLGIKLLLAVLAPIISFFILSDSGRRRFNYVIDVHHNAGILFSTMALLEGKMEDLPNGIEGQARVWKSQVQERKIEVDKLREDYEEWEKKELFRWIWSTYGIAVRVGHLREKVELLQKENVKADNLPPPPAVRMRDDVVTVPGLEGLLYEALLCLKDDGPRVIGIYGTGGIGKTTLLTLINNFLAWMLTVCPVSENRPRVIDETTLRTRINNFLAWKLHPVSGNDAENQAPEEYDFHHVVWAKASEKIDLQGQVARGMGITLSHDSDLQPRAQEIHGYMKNKSFLLLLDDLWGPLDLKELGIPNPEEPNVQFKRKLIFTTRLENVCNSMQTKKKIKVQFLSDNSALRLFTRTLDLSDDDIISVAKDVVEECGGLPLALEAIRDSMSSRNSLKEWKNARDKLKKSEHIQGMDTMLRRLQHSYDSLDDDQMRRFLCCVLWPKGVSIDQDELIGCWMGLELLDKYKYQVDDSYVNGRIYLQQLKEVGLLEAGNNEDHEVKMHNVVRVMALQIASNKYKWMVRAGLKLNKAPAEVQQWMEIDCVSLMSNMIETLPDFEAADGPDDKAPTHFPRLLTLMLQDNPLNQIPNKFFPWMPKLTCLDLSCIHRLTELPGDICGLTGLRYVNLSKAGIKSLPPEFGQLKKLRCLILRDLHKLDLSTPTVIPTKLQELDLYGSSGDWETEGNIFGELKHLQVLKITVRSVPMLLNLSELSSVQLWRIGIEGMDSFTHLDLDQILEAKHMQKHLQELTISLLSNLEVVNVSVQDKDFLPMLQSLTISKCHKLKNISWVTQLRYLELLQVCSCHEMTTLIDEDEDEARKKVEFPHLKHVYLEDLPKVEGINHGKEAFPYFKSAQVTIQMPNERMPGTAEHGDLPSQPLGSTQFVGTTWGNPISIIQS